MKNKWSVHISLPELSRGIWQSYQNFYILVWMCLGLRGLTSLGMSYLLGSWPRILKLSSFCFLFFLNKLSIFIGIFVWGVKYFLPYWGRMHNFMFPWWLRALDLCTNCTVCSKVTIWGDICIQVLCLLNSVFFLFCFVFLFLVFLEGVVFTLCNYFVFSRFLWLAPSLSGCHLSFLAALWCPTNTVMPPSNFLL